MMTLQVMKPMDASLVPPSDEVATVLQIPGSYWTEKKSDLPPMKDQTIFTVVRMDLRKKVWNCEIISQEDSTVCFTRISPDGENGYPGEFQIFVYYEFTDENELRIVYRGACDQTTVANCTNHSYFNLNGEGSGTAMDQYLTIHAQQYTPVGEGSIPLGENVPVEGTPMDFRKPKKIGQDIEADFRQLKLTAGYDHNYVTDDYHKGFRREVAHAWSEESGIDMKVFTDCPGVQFYAANFVENEVGKNGHIYNQSGSFLPGNSDRAQCCKC